MLAPRVPALGRLGHPSYLLNLTNTRCFLPASFYQQPHRFNLWRSSYLPRDRFSSPDAVEHRFVRESVSLPPLEGASLSRVKLTYELDNSNKFANAINNKAFSAISLTAIAGIVLAIYGGTESADSPTLATNDLLKVSVSLFAACYLAFVCLFLILLRQWHAIPQQERKLLLCFACCVPFMVVRFLYGMLGTFVEGLRPQFSVLTGDVTTFLCMAVLEEIFVVAFFVFTGMRLDRLPTELKNGTKPHDSLAIASRSGEEV